MPVLRFSIFLFILRHIPGNAPIQIQGNSSYISFQLTQLRKFFTIVSKRKSSSDNSSLRLYIQGSPRIYKTFTKSNQHNDIMDGEKFTSLTLSDEWVRISFLQEWRFAETTHVSVKVNPTFMHKQAAISLFSGY